MPEGTARFLVASILGLSPAKTLRNQIAFASFKQCQIPSTSTPLLPVIPEASCPLEKTRM